MSAADRGKAAVAAVQRLYAEYNAMVKSGSSKAYRQTFTSTCTVCVGDARQIDSFTRADEIVHGALFSPSQLKVAYVGAKFVVVEGRIAQTAATVTRGGKVVQRYPALAPSPLTWNAESVHGEWLVTKLQGAL